MMTLTDDPQKAIRAILDFQRTDGVVPPRFAKAIK